MLPDDLIDPEARYEEWNSKHIYTGQQVRNIFAELRKRDWPAFDIEIIFCCFTETHWMATEPNSEFGKFFSYEKEG